MANFGSYGNQYPAVPPGSGQQQAGYGFNPQGPGVVPQQPGYPSNQGWGGPQGGMGPGMGGPGAAMGPGMGGPRAMGPNMGGPGAMGGGVPPGVDPNVYQWFVAVDRDRTGKISATELQLALTNSNWSKFNLETCKLMINMFDRDRSGQVDLNEFQALWNYIHQWKGIFDKVDMDKSGSIDANELHSVYLQMGYRLSPQFAQAVVARFDMTGQQKLTLDFFIQSSVLIKTMTEKFRAKDAQNQGVIQIGYEEFITATVANKM